MPLFTNDGNIPFGSEIVTILGKSYVAEEIDFHEKSTKHYRRDERNVPNGGVYIEDITEGSMTLQLLTLADEVPANQSICTIPFRGENVDFVITDVQQPKKQDQIRKLKMTITRILNPSNITTG
jgi:hypothetical protein